MSLPSGAEIRLAENPVGVGQWCLPGVNPDDWQNAFYVASRLGIDGMELVFDGDPLKHPLMSDSGLDMIRRVSNETGVRVLSIFAPFFRRFPVHKENSDTDSILPVLKELIKRCRRLNSGYIVFPCDQDAGINKLSEARALRKALGSCMAEAISCGVNIALMTNLSADKTLNLVRDFDSPAVSIAFDTAVKKADPVKEINTYGPYISSVRVRDRMAGGEPAMLGKGDVDLRLICYKLKEHRFGGPFILSDEVAPNSDGLSKELSYLRSLLK